MGRGGAVRTGVYAWYMPHQASTTLAWRLQSHLVSCSKPLSCGRGVGVRVRSTPAIDSIVRRPLGNSKKAESHSTHVVMFSRRWRPTTTLLKTMQMASGSCADEHKSTTHPRHHSWLHHKRRTKRCVQSLVGCGRRSQNRVYAWSISHRPRPPGGERSRFVGCSKTCSPHTPAGQGDIAASNTSSSRQFFQ